MKINMSDVKITGTLESGDEIIIDMPNAEFFSSTNKESCETDNGLCCSYRQEYIADARVIAQYNANSLNQSLANVSFKSKKSPYLKEESIIASLRNDEKDPFGSEKEKASLYFKEENIKEQSKFKIKTNNKKEKNIMKNNFNFGKIHTDKIAYSIKGIAFKNSNGDYLVYNSDGTAINVSDFVYKIPVFAAPVSQKELKIGDVIRHETPDTPDNFVIVKEIRKNAIFAINPFRNEQITIIPQTSILGFAYYTKIITCNLFTDADKVDENSPFGNMLPFMLMSEKASNKDNLMLMLLMNSKDSEIQKYLPFFLMNE